MRSTGFAWAAPAVNFGPRIHALTPPPAPRLNAPGRLVAEYGEGNWSTIARALNDMVSRPPGTLGRIGKQCREVRARVLLEL